MTTSAPVQDFQVNLNRLLDAAQSKIRALPIAVALEALATVKEHTPVVTGNLRASWSLKVDPNVITISTGVIYARRVEYGFVGPDSEGRQFNQKGRHMVRQTVAEMPQIVARVVARLTPGA